jgi:NAD(P)-dependent dehydrogenase (short-subunit alcohol dehydrogenase family)
MGQVALITGGAQGVGAAIAERLTREGFDRLLLVDRNYQLVEDCAKRLTGGGIKAVAYAAELGSAEVSRAAVQACITHFGQIDVLINAAGNTERGGLRDTSSELFDRLFQTNVKAPFFMMQAAAEHMQKVKSGVIVNISSMLAYGGPPNLATYSASKAALNVLTKSAANTWKRDGIRVHAINLGWTVTPSERQMQTALHGQPADWAETIGQRMPFGRLLTPQDPAGVIAFLVSEDARMMTGNIVDLEQYVMGTFETIPSLDGAPA